MSSEPAGGQIITTTPSATIMASSQLAGSSTPSTTTTTSTTVAAEIVGSTVAGIKETMKTLITTPTARTTTTTSMATPSTTTISSVSSTAAISSSLANDPTKQSVADLSSSLQHFGIVDYCVFVLMLIICAAIGFYFGFIEKKQKKKGQKGSATEQRRGSEALDYLVGGRKMKVFPVSLSLVASFVSGISLLGTSTEIYVYGTQYAFILITLALSGVISWYVFLPVFCNLQLTSTYEYLEMRFDRRLRFFGSVMFLLISLLWMPISIYVPALTFNQVTGIDLFTIIPVVCVICTFYTCIGGIKGVIWTDVLQSFIMIGSMGFVIIKGTVDLGGMGVVYDRNLESGRIQAPEFTFDPTVRMGFFAVFVGGTMLKIQHTCIIQPAVQRFLSLPGMKEVKKCLIIFIIGLVFILGMCIYMGLLAYAHYYDCDPITTKLAQAKDQIVPLYVMQIAGSYPGLAGLFVAGVFSAALSSLSTALNSLSGVLLKDFIEPYRKTPLTERQTAFGLRAIVVVFGMSSMAMVKVVQKLGMVMQLSTTVGSMTAGPLFGMFTVGMTMPFVKTESVLAGCISASVLMGYIAVRSQIDAALGLLRFPTKPVSIDGCPYSFDMSHVVNSTLTGIPPPETAPHAFHHLSFLWYTGLGAATTVVVSLLATFYFGRQDSSEVNPNLIIPKLRRFLKPYKYSSVPVDLDKNAKEMESLNHKENDTTQE
ncbi:sodium-coupled monocarboxylate transporter 1 isoform X2 [Musca domestica]|uniref:Sodium-coupled monocarboxylate transporter 1 isoform X2 n=1 Tax=Musca domestica TaxID=7370 RepID=A0ABM3VFC0_MUSDO|nr:sodium-coupled monocarboxylate transporter 1 isoform X2 [Musca domestica]